MSSDTQSSSGITETLQSPKQILIALCQIHLGTGDINSFRALHSSKLDWVAYRRAINVHHLVLIAASVYHQHKDIPLPPVFRQRLFHTRNLFLRRNLRFIPEIERVSHYFEERNIEVLAYKGVAYSLQFYGNLNERSTRDIDMSFDWKHIREVQAGMKALGYVEAKSSIDFSRPLKKSRAYLLDYPWIKFNSNNQPEYGVDLHWKPAHHAIYLPVDFASLKGRTAELRIQQHTIRTFDPVAHTLIMLIHHGLVDGWGKLYQLIDLVKALKSMNATQKSEFIDLTHKHGLVKSLVLGLCLIDKIWDIPIKLDIEKCVNPKRLDDHISNILSGSLQKNWSDNKNKIWIYLNMRDTFIDKIKSIVSLIGYYFASKSFN